MRFSGVVVLRFALLQNALPPAVPTRTRRVTGSVQGNAGDPVGVMLSPLNGTTAIERTLDPNEGTFQFADVAPGSYMLVARTHAARAMIPLDVRNADTLNMRISIGSGFRTPVHLRIEGHAAADDPEVEKLYFNIRRETPIRGLDPDTYSPFANGRFTLDLFGGDYRIDITQPEGYCMKSMLLDGVDVLNQGLHVTGSTDSTMEIVVASDSGSLEGRTQGRKSTVVLVPDAARRGQRSLIKSMKVSAGGRFRFEKIPPGDYKLFALTEENGGPWLDPEYLRKYEERGTAVRVAGGKRNNAGARDSSAGGLGRRDPANLHARLHSRDFSHGRAALRPEARRSSRQHREVLQHDRRLDGGTRRASHHRPSARRSARDGHRRQMGAQPGRPRRHDHAAGTQAVRLRMVKMLPVLLLLFQNPMPAACSWGPAAEIGTLDPVINESSGLAISRRIPNRAYTHNDSGDTGRFFAMDIDGRNMKSINIAGFAPRDAEDIAIGRCDNSTDCIFIGDIGDNARRRTEIDLVIVREEATFPAQVQPAWLVRLRYPDGPHDAESLAVHPDGTVYIVTKDPARSQVFRLKRDQWRTGKGPQTLEPVAAVDWPTLLPASLALGRVPTSMDIAPDGKRFLILTYTEAVEFFFDLSLPIPEQRTWKEGRDFRRILLTTLEQEEGIAYLPDGLGFVYDSERAIASRPARLFKVGCAK